MELKEIQAFNENDERYSSLVEGGECYAVRFSANKPLRSVGTQCARFSAHNGRLNLSLYKWAGNYDDTVAQKAVAAKSFDLSDGTYMQLKFESREPGEYLFAVHDGSDGTGFCGFLNDHPKTQLYINGTPADGGLELYLIFESDDDDCLNDIEREVLSPAPVYNDIRGSNVDAPGDWVATDGLGRTIGRSECGAVKGKHVGLFYWDWHYRFHHNKPVNLNELMKIHPELKNDYSNPLWEQYMATEYFWDEPVYGYYTSTDKYVIRRQAELFAAAGIDFIVFDCTNGSFTWKDGYETLMETYAEAKADGLNVPAVVFMLNFAPFRDTHTMIRKIYTDIYRRGRFRELWYYLDGKPLIICHNDILASGKPLDNEILNFFTFRRNDPLYFTREPATDDTWGWLSVYPQVGYGKTQSGKPEQMTVGVAHNASGLGLVPMNDYRGGVYGRDYTMQPGFKYSFDSPSGKKTVGHDTDKAYLYGLNFQEQWDHAIESDPEIVFITGYNEWVAGRFPEWQGSPNAFPDEFNDQYSRDIEPTTGELKDNFYYQMASNICRFKGCRNCSQGTSHKSIDIHGDLSQWNDVKTYSFPKNSVPDRDCRGFDDLYFRSSTARNVIIETKSCCDDDYVYFYARCQNDIIDHMQLFISADPGSENWESFNYVIGRNNIDEIEESNGGWDWSVIGKAETRICSDTMLVKIPRSLIPDIHYGSYKWTDNTPLNGDIMDFYKAGCVVPPARFKCLID